MDFYYQPFHLYPDGHQLWASTSESAENSPGSPAFGSAHKVYNVIDQRQSYLQEIVVEGLRALGFHEAADNSVHFSYEMVALSPRCCEELGFELSEQDRKRPYVEVSGRRGLGVKADDLLDRLEALALKEVVSRHQLPEVLALQIARQISIAALRYFMLKYTRNSVIAFDFEDALSFEGETGPYLQYSVVRARNILQKLREREGIGEAEVLARLGAADAAEISGHDEEHGLWALVLEASRLDEIAQQAVRSLEFAGLAKWSFSLAQLFNTFYHRYPVLNEERPDAKIWRAAGVAYFRVQMTRALDLMGIAVPSRM
jgi:arginyl-tRNA synthetase